MDRFETVTTSGRMIALLVSLSVWVSLVGGMSLL